VGANCCEFVKNHTSKILDVWSKLIKQPNQVGDSYKHKQK